MISAQSLTALFRQALKENWGYIWGTSGETWTAAKQKELEKTRDSDRAQGRKYGSKWIWHRVADCSGLFSWAFRQLGLYMYHGSDTMYRKYCVNKGELKKGKRTDFGTLKPGTAVFVWNGEKYSHVGLYAGDGTVIEAMGTVNGVTTTKVTATKWTYWGELTGVDYSNASNEESASAVISGASSLVIPSTSSLVIPSEAEGSPRRSDASFDNPTLRKGSKGQAVKELQTLLLKLGYDLGPCGIDGDFGKSTDAAVRSFQSDHRLTADGIVGTLTWSELRNEESSPAGGKEQLYCVVISWLDLTQAEALQAKYPECEVRKEV